MAHLNDTLAPTHITEAAVEFDTDRKRYKNGRLSVKRNRFTPVRRLTLEWDGISLSEYQALEGFFIARSGGYESFTVTDTHTGSTYTVKFEDDEIKRRPVRRNLRGLYRVRLEVSTV